MDQSSILYSIVIGAIQGITEFLPISSSAHLIVVSTLFKGKTLSISLDVALHAGTLCALLFYFWRDWLELIKAVYPRFAKRQKSFLSDTMFPGLVIGTIPAGFVGLLWEKEIELTFHNPLSTVMPLATIGIVLYLADKFMPQEKSIKDLTIIKAFFVGIMQAAALIPGVSRSGSTILGCRFLKLKRKDSAKFSFMLGTPAMLGATLVHIKQIAQSLYSVEFYLGFSASLIVGCLAISFFLSFLRRFGLGLFALYRLAIAGLILYLFF